MFNPPRSRFHTLSNALRITFSFLLLLPPSPSQHPTTTIQLSTFFHSNHSLSHRLAGRLLTFRSAFIVPPTPTLLYLPTLFLTGRSLPSIRSDPLLPLPDASHRAQRALLLAYPKAEDRLVHAITMAPDQIRYFLYRTSISKLRCPDCPYTSKRTPIPTT
jgi:hypothetical protein